MSTEQELKRAFKKLKEGKASVIGSLLKSKWYEIIIICDDTGDDLARADLRKLVSQRAPLKGIKRGFSKLISSKRKKRK